MPQDGSRVIGEDSEVPSVSGEGIATRLLSRSPPTPLPPPPLHTRGLRDTYFEKGSDFPVGKPLPCVLVSTFPQCTATWQSLCSTILQYSCWVTEKKPSAWPRSHAVSRATRQTPSDRESTGGLTSTSAAPGSLLKHMVMVFRAILKKLVKDTDFPWNEEMDEVRQARDVPNRSLTDRIRKSQIRS